MVKAKVSFLTTEEAVKLKSGAKTMNETMCGKLGSTDQTAKLSSIYKRTDSVATARSISRKEIITKRRAVEMTNSLGGQNFHPGFPSTQSVSGILRNTNGAEDRPGKRVASSVNTKSTPHSVVSIKSYNSGFSSSIKSKESNDGCGEEMMSNSFGGLSFHPGYPSTQSVSGSIKDTTGAEDRRRKQVIPSINGKSTPHSVMSIKSYNSGVSSSLKSEEWNDGCERAESPLNQKEEIVSVLRKKLSCNSGPMDVIMPAKEVKASRSRMEQSANNSTSLVLINPQLIGNPGSTSLAGAYPTNHETQKTNSLRISFMSQKYPLNGPALEAIWKGTFEVLDLSSDIGFCEGFLAHPPFKVSERAYMFSKQIAGVLQFKVNPLGELWPEIFQTRRPDWHDIALYFYPGHYERSRKKYADLLKFILKNDLVLRSRMGRVELLVFSSKALALDCQEIEGNYYMWGVFRHLKGDTVT